MSKGKNFSCNNVDGKRKKSDFYETPYSMTQQLLDVEKFHGSIFDPACGDLAIIKVLEKNGYYTLRADLSMGFDFLKRKATVANIVTNPPFSISEEFILHAKKIAENKIAMLLPLSYLHGESRYANIYQDKEFPLETVYVFTRYPMLGDPLREDGKYRTGMMVYAWFVWNKEMVEYHPPYIKHISNQEFVLSKKEFVNV